MSTTSIVLHPTLGRVVQANRDIAIGERFTVGDLSPSDPDSDSGEEALLSFPGAISPEDQSDYQRLQKVVISVLGAHKVSPVYDHQPEPDVVLDADIDEDLSHPALSPPATRDVLWFYTKLSEEQRDRFQHFAYPNEGTWLNPVATLLAQKAKHFLPSRFLAFSDEELARAVLVMATNAHATRNGAALYENGSKLAHSCTPNSFPVISTSNRLSYLAIKPIKAVEQCTTSYIGTDDVTSMCTTPMRRAILLRTKFFFCRCPRCNEPDTLRLFRCPNCASERCTRLDTADEPAAPTSDTSGELGTTQSSASSLTSPPSTSLKTSSNQPWLCRDCHQTFPSSSFALDIERDCSLLIRKISESMPSLQTRLPTRIAAHERVKDIQSTASSSLGPSHWIVIWADLLLGLTDVVGELEASKRLFAFVKNMAVRVGPDRPDVVVKYLIGTMDRMEKWGLLKELMEVVERFEPFIREDVAGHGTRTRCEKLRKLISQGKLRKNKK